MIAVNIQKQGNLVVHPVKNCPKRYSLKMLLEGITPEAIADMNAKTAWSREGNAMGREEI